MGMKKQDWIDDACGHEHMVVWCDLNDYVVYPIYCDSWDELHKEFSKKECRVLVDLIHFDIKYAQDKRNSKWYEEVKFKYDEALIESYYPNRKKE